MSEDRFFNQVRETLHDYAPEVPQGIYGAMRKKLWWSNFTKLSATRFNMWYAVLIVGLGSFLIAKEYSVSSCPTTQQGEKEQSAIPKFKSFDTICAPKANTAIDNSKLNSTVSNEAVAVISKGHSVRHYGKNSTNNQLTPTPVEVVTPASELVPEVMTTLPTETVTVTPEELPTAEAPVQGETRKGKAFLIEIPVDDSLNAKKVDEATKKKD